MVEMNQTDRILVFKSKRGRKEYKVTKKMRGSYTPSDCSMTINLGNYQDVALFLHDLEDLYGVKMDKAVRQYLADKSNNWPF